MTSWLIDKSALVRLGASPDAAEWASRIELGLVRITTVTRVEVGYSARSALDLRAGLRQPPVSAMPVEYLTPATEDRAVEVLTLLADRGQHRAPPVPDLRPGAVRPRLAYLLSGVDPAVADRLQPATPSSVTWFGSSRASRRYDKRFNVADGLLPFDPRILEEPA